jgi:hypothetical protein
MNKPLTVSEKLAELYKSKFETTPCEKCGEQTPVPYSYCFDCEYPEKSEKYGNEEFEGDDIDEKKWSDSERWNDDPDNHS